MLPPVEPPVLGVGLVGDFGAGALPEEPLPIEPDELPLVPEDELPLEPEGLLVLPLLELEPDLLKWASQSEREIVPSLLVSTDEKLGWDALGLAALGDVALPDVPPAAPVDLAESAAMASDESANSAAAVVMVTVFSICGSFMGGECNLLPASGVPGRRLSCGPWRISR